MRKTCPNFSIQHYWKPFGEKRFIIEKDLIYLDGYGVDQNGKTYAFEYLGKRMKKFVLLIFVKVVIFTFAINVKRTQTNKMMKENVKGEQYF